MRLSLVFPLAAAALLSACTGSRSAVSSAPVSATTAVPTKVIVHVATHDAKLIGSAVGGVRITIRDVNDDRVLATGLHEGGTGDTRRLMQEPRSRGDRIFTAPDGARFETTIPLTMATPVEVIAEGPLGYPDQMARTSKRLMLVPGRDLVGDGVVLEMHGYVIDLLTPDSTRVLQGGGRLNVRARVRMLCSCPTGPEALWQVEEVRARLVRNGLVVQDVPLTYAGTASEYAGTFPSTPPGTYTLEIIASSPKSTSFGVVRRAVEVRR